MIRSVAYHKFYRFTLKLGILLIIVDFKKKRDLNLGSGSNDPLENAFLKSVFVGAFWSLIVFSSYSIGNKMIIEI